MIGGRGIEIETDLRLTLLGAFARKYSIQIGDDDAASYETN